MKTSFHFPIAENDDDGPSVGEYFLYAIYNRMVGACSKRAMPDWYRHTAIQHIRPVRIDELNSQMFWQKWDQVGEQQLQQIAADFLHRLAELKPSSSGQKSHQFLGRSGIGMSLAEVARAFKMSVPGIGYAVERGESLARANNYQLISWLG